MVDAEYKGSPLFDVPSDYLAWCLRECRNLRAGLREAIVRELANRAQDTMTCPESPASSLPHLASKLQQVYRQMALRHHPDRGGFNEVMQAINEFHDRLQKAIQDDADGGKV